MNYFISVELVAWDVLITSIIVTEHLTFDIWIWKLDMEIATVSEFYRMTHQVVP